MKPIGVGWAKLPGTAILIAQSRAILPTRLHREVRPRGQRAVMPCTIIRRCGADALPTLIWGLLSQASRLRLGIGFWRFGAPAAPGALRNAASRRGRHAQGLASRDL